MEKEETREFDLGAVLCVTTGRLFTSMEDVYEVLNFLTGTDVFTHELKDLRSIAEEYIISSYPQLKGVGKDVKITSWDDAQKFIDEQKKIYGEKIALKPMAKEAKNTPSKPRR